MTYISFAFFGIFSWTSIIQRKNTLCSKLYYLTGPILDIYQELSVFFVALSLLPSRNRTKEEMTKQPVAVGSEAFS